MKFMQ